MRIIDDINNKLITSVTIMLTPNEASEMISKLKILNPDLGEHVHINDIEYKREITLAIYTDQNQQNFSERIREIISEK